MPKRTLVSASSSPKKRAKATSNQYSLDKFFCASNHDAGASSTRLRANNSQISTPSAGGSGQETLSADEELAWKLAKEDGLDLESLRQLEETGFRGSAAGRKTARSEVIDVDLLDNQDNEAGPSTSPVTPIETVSHTVPRVRARRSSPSVRSQLPAAGTAHGNAYPSDPPAYRELAIDPPSYTPGLDDWPSSNPVPYSFLAYALASLAETRSRIAIVNILTNTLRTIIICHPPSLLPALYLLSNSLSPSYSPVELGLGPSVISKAIQHVSGLTPAALKRLYHRTGDPGDVAFEAKSNVRTLVPHPPLLVPGVYDALLRIANAKGQGAIKQKQAVVEKLLVAAKGEEIRFLVRILCQNLRVGAVRTTLLTALARAMVLTPPPGIPTNDTMPSRFYVSQDALDEVKPLMTDSKKKVADPARLLLTELFQTAESLLKEVYVRHPNYDNIAKALLEVGLDGLAERLPLTVGIPLLPTLGSPTRSLDEIYDRLGLLPFTAELKYDGQRAQIHANKVDGSASHIKIFSRHLEDMTDKYPDVVSLVGDILSESLETTSFIIDAEIVAVDPIDGSLKTFQELSNRARKDVKIDDVKVSVGVFAFDLMYLDGQVLLERPFRERRALLRSRFPPRTPQEHGAARFCHVVSCESEDGREAVEDFWQMALSSATEGLMVKLLDSGEILEEPNQRKDRPRRKPLPATYEPDKRTSAWLKLKKDYVTGLGDSLDLVPVGAWHGNGRKAQWWSPILLAVWDPAAGQLVAVCKCMSGFTDAFYKDLGERYPLDSETCSKQPMWDPVCDTGGLKPEVYFKPQEVWEIRGADVTISPVSVAALGLVVPKRGLSLRFPRFIRIVEDKGIENASTPEFLAKMWRDQQANGKDRTGADDGELVDVEILSEEAEEDIDSEDDCAHDTTVATSN
ncbi:ATP-dependent DNA ligase [Obba rivulosa]|uniref:DNA ligase n=1 Tax=Obba rivulosa TaxID=1052685 RepID=A0A8E2DST2_9APHY|nr:ATP-dependent DNA ligase [Obba rivulosa]